MMDIHKIISILLISQQNNVNGVKTVIESFLNSIVTILSFKIFVFAQFF